MKTIGFVILLMTLTFPVLGQQYLWSTEKLDSVDVKYVPLNKVKEEVLTFYDHYDYYYDLSGYSKEKFIEEYSDGFDYWNLIYDINDLTVSALRTNTGSGSIVLIMCVNDKNVNMIIFSNDSILQKNSQYTHSSEKDKFISWFMTLLN